MRGRALLAQIARWVGWFAAGGAIASPGVYNMGGPDRVSRVDVAQAVAAFRGYDATRIKAVARASLPPSATASPPDIAMDSGRLAAVTGIAPSALQQMLSPTFERA